MITPGSDMAHDFGFNDGLLAEVTHVQVCFPRSGSANLLPKTGLYQATRQERENTQPWPAGLSSKVAIRSGIRQAAGPQASPPFAGTSSLRRYRQADLYLQAANGTILGTDAAAVGLDDTPGDG